jgi:YVTN family beta-propeller protein
VISPTNQVLTTLTVGAEPLGVAVSATGATAGDVYVTNQASGTVSVIDPTTNTVLTTITVGNIPIGVAVA